MVTEATVSKSHLITPSGCIAYIEAGEGPVALFVHGVLMNGHLWRHQLAELSDVRRCIALDLLAHGDTEATDGASLSVTANAHMIGQFIAALGVDQVDLIGNDSGGGICQIVTANYPERIRSLVLTDCDTHTNWPPEAFAPFLNIVARGGLRETLAAMLADKSIYRSADALGLAYEDPHSVTDEDIEIYLRPFLRSAQHLQALERFLMAFDNAHTVCIEAHLKALHAKTLIVWGTDDVYFSVEWAKWLYKTIPGAVEPVELLGARLFFPEERYNAFNAILRRHFAA